MKESVSIILPVYNVAPYLDRCMESILRQSHPAWEAVLVDDGSTDGSGALCDAYAQKHDNIRCLHQANQGVSAARNAGLEWARGDYILFVDPDDWLSDHMLEVMLQKGDGADMIVCDTYDVVQQEGQMRVTARHTWQQGDAFTADKYYDVACKTTTVWNKMIRKDILSKYRFDPALAYAEDSDLIVRILPETERVVVVPEPLYYYLRNRQGNTVTSKLDRKTIESLQYQIAIYRELTRQGKPTCGVGRVCAAIMDVFRKVDDPPTAYGKTAIRACGSAIRETRWRHRAAYMFDRHFQLSVKGKLLIPLLSYVPYTAFRLLRRKHLV